jgi:hypothetical protein
MDSSFPNGDESDAEKYALANSFLPCFRLPETLYCCRFRVNGADPVVGLFRARNWRQTFGVRPAGVGRCRIECRARYGYVFRRVCATQLLVLSYPDQALPVPVMDAQSPFYRTQHMILF